MVKYLKKFMFIFAVCCLLSGCMNFDDLPLDTVPSIEQAYKEDPTAFVVFTQSIEPRENYVPIADIMEYESMYAEYNGTWFRNQLEGEDLCIYNAYLYALDHYFIGFELYVEDNDRDFYYIREALSLDSPFIAQNYDQSEYIWDRPTNYRGERIFVGIEQFTESRWKKNNQALEKCQQVVANIPASCTTQRQKMEYLYQYVCDNVQYTDYDRIGKDDYLYDAVIKGETVCDGYSNMLNLLFSLIGVESYEAMGSNIEDEASATTEELENASGHTWVVARMDGEFYNFDPTYEDTDNRDDGSFYYFGYSDALVSVKYLDLEEMRPKCTNTALDFWYADLVISNIKDNSEIKKIGKLTQDRAKDKIYTSTVAVQTATTDKTVDKMLDKYFRYVTKIKYIEVQPEYMKNSTILRITVKPR